MWWQMSFISLLLAGLDMKFSVLNFALKRPLTDVLSIISVVLLKFLEFWIVFIIKLQIFIVTWQ